MICPICSGTGVITSEKRHPQGEPKVRTCPACYGLGEMEEVKTDRPILTIYKAHGIYASEQLKPHSLIGRTVGFDPTGAGSNPAGVVT